LAEDRRTAGSTAGHYATFRVQFEPHPDIYLNGTNPLQLIAELHELGDCTLIPYLDKVPRMSELDPARCLIRFDAFVTTRAGRNAIHDVFMVAEGESKVVVEEIDDPETLREEPFKRLGEILAERGVAKPEDIEAAVRNQLRIGEMLVDGAMDPNYVKAAVEEQEHVRCSCQKLQSEMRAQSIRVSSEKLNDLVDLVGELVTLQARLAQTAARIGNTELDKTVIERLNDPLVHIIRNSLDHGIERHNPVS